MTREVYNVLTEVLDNLEQELQETKKNQQAKPTITEDLPVPTIRIKIDLNISIK